VQACLREILEETGLVLSAEALTVLKQGLLLVLPEGGMTIRKDLFVARVDTEGPVVLGPEHDAFVWSPLGAVEERLHWPSTRTTSSLVRSHLAQVWSRAIG